MKRSSGIFAFLGLVVLAWIPYVGSLGNEYVYDDVVFVSAQPGLTEGPLWELFAKDFHEPHRQSGLYRPLTALSYAVPIRLGLEGPEAQRVLQLVLNLGAGCLLLVLAKSLGLRGGTSFFAAALFVCHPLHTEAVALVSGRSELLATVFMLAALSLLAVAEEGGKSGAFRLLLALVCGVFGALSKETGFVLPGLVFALEIVRRPVSGRSLASGGLRALLFASVLLAVFGIRSRIVDSIPTQGFQVENPLIGLSFLERLPTLAAILSAHLRLLLFPVRLSADYSAHQFEVADSFLDGRSLVGLSFAVLIVWGAARTWPRFGGGPNRRGIWFGIVVFVVTLLPVMNFIPIGTIFAERHVYAPSLGFCLCLALFASALDPSPEEALPRSLGSFARIGVCVFLLLCYGSRTALRTPDFLDEEVFYRRLIVDAPRSAKAQWLLANHRIGQGRTEEAEKFGARALEIESRFPEALYGMAYLAYSEGELAKAGEYARRCLIHAPNFAPGEALLGSVAFARGDYSEAVQRYRRALDIDPNLPEVRGYLEDALRRSRE